MLCKLIGWMMISGGPPLGCAAAPPTKMLTDTRVESTVPRLEKCRILLVSPPRGIDSPPNGVIIRWKAGGLAHRILRFVLWRYQARMGFATIGRSSKSKVIFDNALNTRINGEGLSNSLLVSAALRIVYVMRSSSRPSMNRAAHPEC